MLMLLIEVAGERFAIDIAPIVKVLPMLQITRVPEAPRGIAGVFNCHGDVVPAVDLSELVAGRPTIPRLATRIVLIRHPDGRGQDRLVGLIAERVTQTERFEPGDFVGSGVNHREAKYLGPVIPAADGVIQYVEAASLLSPAVWDALFAVQEQG